MIFQKEKALSPMELRRKDFQEHQCDTCFRRWKVSSSWNKCAINKYCPHIETTDNLAFNSIEEEYITDEDQVEKFKNGQPVRPREKESWKFRKSSGRKWRLMWHRSENNRLRQVIPGPFREPLLLKLLPEEVVYFTGLSSSSRKLENLSKMTALPGPVPKVASEPSHESDQEVYVYEPHINKWIKWKSSNKKYEVQKGSHGQEEEEKFTSMSPEDEFCASRNECLINFAVEKKLSDWLIPKRDDIIEEPKMRPVWDKVWKKTPKRCFGSTEAQTEQELCQSMKHFLEIPCLSLESLLTTVREKGHHINLNDRYCKTEKEKNPSGKPSKEPRSHWTRNGKKEARKRCRVTKRHIWQMVDDDGKSLPFGAVSSRRKGPNDEKEDGVDIWVRLDCVSVLITKIIEEKKREQRDRYSKKIPKPEIRVASEAEENYLLENQREPKEDPEFVEIPLEQSPRLSSIEEKKSISSEACCHKTTMTESSTDESLSQSKPNVNSMETQSSSVSHEGSGEGSCEIQMVDIHPSTSSSSESQNNVSNTEICKLYSKGNELSRKKPAEDFAEEYRHHRIFPRFSALNFQKRHERRARKTRIDEYNNTTLDLKATGSKTCIHEG